LSTVLSSHDPGSVRGFSAQFWVELRRFAFPPQGSLSWWVKSGIGVQEQSNLWWVSPVPVQIPFWLPMEIICPLRTSVGSTQILLLSVLVWINWVTFPADWCSLWICIQESLQVLFLPRGFVKRTSHGIETHIRGWELCAWGPAGKYFRQLFIELSVTNREGLKSTITIVW
jgi:hypothetical protein